MSEINIWFRDMSWEKIWNAPETEIRWTLRVFVILSIFQGLYFIHAYCTAQTLMAAFSADSPVPVSTSLGYAPLLQLGLTFGLALITVAAVASRSFIGWLGLVVFASQMVMSPMFAVGLLALYWLAREPFRDLFDEKSCGPNEQRRGN